MSLYKLPRMQIFLLLLSICFSIYVPTTNGQKDLNGDQTDDVVRIKSELVQTDVVVLDKKGRFVEGLRPDQFELSVDGKPRTVSFFERVTSGSKAELAQLAAARGQSSSRDPAPAYNAADMSPRGRLIFFFLDDLHLSNASLARAREALTRFVDERMNPDDQIAVCSASGQIGFLQQLTDNRAVLREAIRRLGYKQNREAYTGKTQISEYMASQVMDSGNRELYAYLLESTKIEQQMGPGSRHGDHTLAASYSATTYLKNRLSQVNTQGRISTADTLSALRSLMLSSSSLPGRKLVFFLSDGFIVNERKSGALNMLEQITLTAARANAVVYTMDLRGNYYGFGATVDASTNEYADSSARKAGLAGELAATRESLQFIADETGGRAIFNTDSIDDGILRAISETSDYYLLAWRPDGDEQRKGRSRLKVSVKDRPELTVRLRTSYYDSSSPLDTAKKTRIKESKNETQEPAASPQETREAELVVTLGSLYSKKELPVAMSIGFVDTPASEMTLKVSMQIDRSALNMEESEKAKSAEVDVIGAAIDDRGIISTFKQVLAIRPGESEYERQVPIVWHQQLSVPPGLYQVRVAIRERETGRTGSTMNWIEIPDMSKGRFDLSSLFLGERSNEHVKDSSSNGPRTVMVDVDHKFVRTSVLRFQTYVYNASRGINGPDVWIQAQILRNNQQVYSTSPALVPITGDHTRLPYWTEIPLSQLPSGRYVLQVLATDRVKNSSTSEHVSFSIE